jgi:ankyrin repeat protein
MTVKSLNEELWDAVMRSDAVAVRSIVESGARLFSEDLRYSIRLGLNNMALLILDLADAKLAEHPGALWDAISAAAGHGRPGWQSVLSRLLDGGAAERLRGESRTTPLHTAIQRVEGPHIVHVAQLLMERGEPIDEKSEGKTPLIAAAERGLLELVDLLLERGAAVNARDNHGKDALIHAASHGFVDVVTLLLRRGADVRTADHKGKRAIDYCQTVTTAPAKESGKVIFEMLLRHERLAEAAALDTELPPPIALPRRSRL